MWSDSRRTAVEITSSHGFERFERRRVALVFEPRHRKTELLYAIDERSGQECDHFGSRLDERSPQLNGLRRPRVERIAARYAGADSAKRSVSLCNRSRIFDR